MVLVHSTAGFASERTRLQHACREELGLYDRSTVSRYLAYTDLGYGYEWCAAFVSYCFGKVGYDAPRTPWSPALFPKSKVIWSYHDQRSRPVRLQPGMVWGIYIGSKKRIGHVGFVDSYNNGVVTTVEGNTSDPQGKTPNGVYRKRRLWRTIHSVAEWLHSSTGSPTASRF